MANETLEAFLLLGLENIPDDWVSQLWSDNFCESSPLSVEDHYALFNEANWQAVVSLATEWLDTNVESEGNYCMRFMFILSIERVGLHRVPTLGGSRRRKHHLQNNNRSNIQHGGQDKGG